MLRWGRSGTPAAPSRRQRHFRRLRSSSARPTAASGTSAHLVANGSAGGGEPLALPAGMTGDLNVSAKVGNGATTTAPPADSPPPPHLIHSNMQLV